MDECRIDAAASLSDPRGVSDARSKPAKGRDRFSVDLKGLKSSLLATARCRGISPSELIRSCVAAVLQSTKEESPQRLSARYDVVRLALQIERSDAQALRLASRRSGLPAGDFVAMLVRQGDRPTERSSSARDASDLVASCAILTSLARDLREMSRLLSIGEGAEARHYRSRLVQLEPAIQSHLRLASAVLGELKHLKRISNRDDLDGSD